MGEVAAAFLDRDLHVVLDDPKIHKNDAAQRWLEGHSHVPFHHTSTHASRVKPVKCFFSILSKRGLAQSVHRSKKQLKDLLLKFLANYNDSCQPSTRTKGPEQIRRIIGATKQYHPEHPPKRRRPKRQQTHKVDH